MKRALRDKWAAALEGGKFTQVRGCLRNWQNETCCLGVLADVYDPTKWIDNTNEGENYSFGSASNKAELPPYVLHEIGLSHRQQGMFIKMNDNRHLSFEQIAVKVRQLRVED